MARYLAYTSPARGHLYPIIETLLELRGRGHEIHLRSLASELDAVRALGIHAEPIAPAIEALPLEDWHFANQQEALMSAVGTFAERATHELGDLQRAISQVKPDCLLVDTTTVGAAAVAEASGLQWAQWCPFFQHATLAPDIPPVTTLIPFTIAPPGLEVLNAPRRAVGLPELTDPVEARRSPLCLYFTASPFETDEFDLPPSYRAVGPGLWEPPADPPAWLDEIAAPLVLVTASSEYQLDDALVTTALQALASDPVRVAASSVAHDPTAFETPPNARVERWLPHGPLVRKAACVVCHGGMGITQRALAAGVPVCVVPFGRDQFEVAARVKATGGGTLVMPDQLSPDTLGAAIRTAMTMQAGAQRIAAGFARAGGAQMAAEALQSLLVDRPDARQADVGQVGAS